MNRFTFTNQLRIDFLCPPIILIIQSTLIQRKRAYDAGDIKVLMLAILKYHLDEKFYFYIIIKNWDIMAENKNSYEAEDIQVLKGLEGVNSDT